MVRRWVAAKPPRAFGASGHASLVAALRRARAARARRVVGNSRERAAQFQQRRDIPRLAVGGHRRREDGHDDRDRDHQLDEGEPVRGARPAGGPWDSVTHHPVSVPCVMTPWPSSLVASQDRSGGSSLSEVSAGSANGTGAVLKATMESRNRSDRASRISTSLTMSGLDLAVFSSRFRLSSPAHRSRPFFWVSQQPLLERLAHVVDDLRLGGQIVAPA